MECKIAAQFLPNWDGPAVECGIMLANVGEYDAALRDLDRPGRPSPKRRPSAVCHRLRADDAGTLRRVFGSITTGDPIQAGFRVSSSPCRPVRFHDGRHGQGSSPRQSRPTVGRLCGVDGLAGGCVFLPRKGQDRNTTSWMTVFTNCGRGGDRGRFETASPDVLEVMRTSLSISAMQQGICSHWI